MLKVSRVLLPLQEMSHRGSGEEMSGWLLGGVRHGLTDGGCFRWSKPKEKELGSEPSPVGAILSVRSIR